MTAKVALLIVAGFVSAGMLALPTEPARADSIRCGTKMVEVGESAETLMQTCGPPTYRVTAHYAGGESWYYNRGDARFMMKVVTLGGKIIAIEQGDYGINVPVGP